VGRQRRPAGPLIFKLLKGTTMAADTSVEDIRDIANMSREFSFDMYKFNTEQAMDGQRVEGATHVTNNWLNKPNAIAVTQ
jgi:hypothetical protein